ncbi:putative o-methyltransferase family protein [Phaeoacremonium minimum UCRPA7]|uniref:Putative o-methyltransferase family protein n=1 Tax=Phaeoacremonium minimum (strain UCR-PA7) TaxID=1286976 RepID=R8BTL0_PHAM7|nr:putative o-methyltransferase family protein [Phaeoacremonium minimum UCRPA7]EOO02696.1 putative o-methyltransferase family protein [Phaeoacremonium minimum UCRPA7]
MKDNLTVLYPNPETSQKVAEYSVSKSLVLPEYIRRYHEYGLTTSVPDYMISTYQGSFLVWLARTLGAKRILEVGVYIGFSSLCWAHAAGPDGFVTGLEYSEEYANQARAAFEKNGVKNVEVVVGDGLETISTIDRSKSYDLIFIDAQKTGYPRYLELILEHSQPGAANRLLKPGGVIVADNVLRRATVADPTPNNPHYVREIEKNTIEGTKSNLEGLHKFNDRVANDPRLEGFLLPLFDGLSLARLLD